LTKISYAFLDALALMAHGSP